MRIPSALSTAGLAFCMTASAWSQPQDTQPAGKPGQTSPSGAHMEHRFDDPDGTPSRLTIRRATSGRCLRESSKPWPWRPGQVVADIGAGTGYFTVRLAKAAAQPKVYAVDVEKSMVEYIRQRAAKEGLRQVVAVQGSAERANLPEPVDVALIVDTYHHIPNRPVIFPRTSQVPEAVGTAGDHRFSKRRAVGSS